MSRTLLLLAIAFMACLYLVDAHRPRQPKSAHDLHRMKRSSTAASQCSYMTCALSGGSCSTDGSALVFCPVGEYCDGSVCQASLSLGSACNANAPENQCAEGSCVDSVCQIYREILPGNPCTADSQCYFSNSADGSDVVASTCTNGVCAGYSAGTSCVASHQCVSGTFCSTATSTCTTLGNNGDSCSADSECNARYTCLNGKCSARYTQNEGDSCSTTQNCAPGLYCNSGSCAKASTAGRTATTCDIQANDCGAGMECSCADFTTQGQSATCAAVQGTYANMPKVEAAAFDCLDANACGSDASSNATVACIQAHCLSAYCTYFTRTVPELFEEFPSCLMGRIVGSESYFSLLQTCAAYQPSKGQTTATSSASAVASAALSWIALVSLSLFFFAF